MPNTNTAVSQVYIVEREFPRTLFGTIDELLNCGNAVVRHVVVVRHGIETGARSSLISWPWRHELVIPLIAHVLGRSIKRRNADRSLPLHVGSSGLCLLGQARHNAWIGIGDAGNGQGDEGGSSLHVGSMRIGVLV